VIAPEVTTTTSVPSPTREAISPDNLAMSGFVRRAFVGGTRTSHLDDDRCGAAASTLIDPNPVGALLAERSAPRPWPGRGVVRGLGPVEGAADWSSVPRKGDLPTLTLRRRARRPCERPVDAEAA